MDVRDLCGAPSRRAACAPLGRDRRRGLGDPCRAWLGRRQGEIDPKSKKGAREVPVVGVLRKVLLEHKARTGRRGREFVFGTTAERPFSPTNIRRKALRAWAS